MGRPRTLTIEEVVKAASELRKVGVAAFEWRGVKINFAPNVPSGLGGEDELDPFVAAEKVKSAVEQFNKINREDELNLNWSVG